MKGILTKEVATEENMVRRNESLYGSHGCLMRNEGRFVIEHPEIRISSGLREQPIWCYKTATCGAREGVLPPRWERNLRRSQLSEQLLCKFRWEPTFFSMLSLGEGRQIRGGTERLRDKGKHADSELRTVSAFCAKRQRGVNPALAIWVMEVICDVSCRSEGMTKRGDELCTD